MTTTIYHQIREILVSHLTKSGLPNDSLKLRPPREAKWGDLSSNIVQILGGGNEAAEQIKNDLLALDAVDSVEIAPTQDMNIRLTGRYWRDQICALSEQGIRYGWSGEKPALILQVPAGDADLMALKRRWSAEALVKFAQMLGGTAEIEEVAALEAAGFNAKAALAKCGEAELRLGLLTHDDDFAIHFSPIKAHERSYEAPAFLYPYTYATINRLLRQKVEAGDEVLEMMPVAENATFKNSEELALCRHLTEWPQILHKSLSEKTLVNLTGFLTEASLLFFKLYEAERLQSSDYLTSGECAPLRQELLKAMAHLLGDALDALGHDRVEEFI